MPKLPVQGTTLYRMLNLEATVPHLSTVARRCCAAPCPRIVHRVCPSCCLAYHGRMEITLLATMHQSPDLTRESMVHITAPVGRVCSRKTDGFTTRALCIFMLRESRSTKHGALRLDVLFFGFRAEQLRKRHAVRWLPHAVAFPSARAALFGVWPAVEDIDEVA